MKGGKATVSVGKLACAHSKYKPHHGTSLPMALPPHTTVRYCVTAAGTACCAAAVLHRVMRSGGVASPGCRNIWTAALTRHPRTVTAEPAAPARRPLSPARAVIAPVLPLPLPLGAAAASLPPQHLCRAASSPSRKVAARRPHRRHRVLQYADAGRLCVTHRLSI